jgi:hypothetical protein
MHYHWGWYSYALELAGVDDGWGENYTEKMEVVVMVVVRIIMCTEF